MELSNKLFLVFFIVVFFVNIGYGQIKVSSNGLVGIGTSTPTNLLDVLGTGRFYQNDSYYGTRGVKISTYCGISVLDPLSSNNGALGFQYSWGTLHVNQIYSPNPIITGSDERLKENITGLSNPLQTVLKLRGVKYDLKSEMFRGLNDTASFIGYGIPQYDLKNHIGMLAQEVQLIVPEVVAYDSLRQIFGIKYSELIPYLIEAIKECKIRLN